MTKPKGFFPRAQYLASLPRKRCGCGVLIRNDDGKILLVKPSYKNHWTLPGGTVDENESPLNTAIREVKEELSISIKVKKFIGVYYGSDRTGDFLQFYFDAGILSEDSISRIKVDGEEILEKKFVAPDKISSYAGIERSDRLLSYLKYYEKYGSLYADDTRII